MAGTISWSLAEEGGFSLPVFCLDVTLEASVVVLLGSLRSADSRLLLAHLETCCTKQGDRDVPVCMNRVQASSIPMP